MLFSKGTLFRTVGVLLCCLLLLGVNGQASKQERKTGEGREKENVEGEGLGFPEVEPVIAMEEDSERRAEDTTPEPDPEENVQALCETPRPPENGYIKGDNFSYDAVVYVECEEGYKLSGPSKLTCLPVPYPHAPGVWVPQDGYRCLSQSEEPERMEPLPSEENFDDGVQPVITDLRDISLGAESDAEDSSSFEDIRCTTPKAPENGQVIGSDFSMGASIQYLCKEGFMLIGPDHATCLAVPDPFHHRAIWDPPTPPKCQISAAPPYLMPSTSSRDNMVTLTDLRRSHTAPYADQVEGLQTVCSLPKDIGPCREATPRYYFNVKTMECSPFIFGGCHGNGNNFETFVACQQTCR